MKFINFSTIGLEHSLGGIPCEGMAGGPRFDLQSTSLNTLVLSLN